MDITELQNIVFSDLRNPFRAGNVSSVDIHISQSRCTADISFVNGNTSGNHTIYGLDFKDLMAKLDEFFEEMKAKT